ncbi:hypothetical protein BpHYR1_013275 [Brachionus plicatilis]|uniref:Uncharacterized protein n=1 Tax=Brachionus plicatilis TaxID=10195 RepID=A0A3M7SQ65_BRAPC|nr:hypothetical protein BpHYR1_013275 [Brachionus plicatilis]
MRNKFISMKKLIKKKCVVYLMTENLSLNQNTAGYLNFEVVLASSNSDGKLINRAKAQIDP